MTILAGTLVVMASILGVALTAVTLPGSWLALATAVACTIWKPELLSWWTIGSAAAIAFLAELFELIASGVGARKFGGSRRSAWGAVIGSIVGAIAGTPLLPPIGTIAGAVLGAGAGALIAERGSAGNTWGQSAKVAGGAAAGRLVSTVVKTIASAVIAVILCVGALA